MGIALFIALVSFGGLAWLVQSGRTQELDVAALTLIHDNSNVGTDIFFSFITNLGDPLFLLPLGLLLSALLLRRQRPLTAIIVVSLFSITGVLTSVLKSIFDRVRPDLWYHPTIETSFSFPSGHAAGSAIVALTLIYLAWQHGTMRPILLIVMPLYVLSVSASRLFLGVHYPSDIIGGWLIATITFLAVLLIIRLTGARTGNNLR